ncbi:MAG: hypothetical protein NTZ83_06760 [Candidatus Pacearchaeota archaeon]|nr:hypothetical protein [Candidatus Pacearchaeota archaeon]
MRKTLTVFALAVMLFLTAGIVSATQTCGDGNCRGTEDCTTCPADCGVCVCDQNSGSIWTTKGDCGTVQQDANEYAIGEKVFINGANFCPGTYNWTITGQPGGASCDPNKIVATATPILYTVDSSGAFCFEAYTVQADDVDCGGNVYNVDFNGKGDNYHVNENLPLVPEFGTTVGILTALGALGVFFLVRRK